MNFEELQDAWAKEAIPATTLPPLLSQRTNSAIIRIRRNMKATFIWTFIGYMATLIILLFSSWTRLSFLIIFPAAFLFVQTIYYFSRFFLFYRRTARYDMGLRKNLRRFTYELELNMEIYKTYSFCVAPVSCLLWIAILNVTGHSHWAQIFLRPDTPLPGSTILIVLLILLGAQAIGAFVLHLHLNRQYGMYLRELKKVMADLDEE